MSTTRLSAACLVAATLAACGPRPDSGTPEPDDEAAAGADSERTFLELAAVLGDPERLSPPPERWSLGNEQLGGVPPDLVLLSPERQLVVLLDRELSSLVALEVASGELVWAVTLPPGVPGVTAEIVPATEGSVLFVSRGETVAAIRLEDGATLWEQVLDGSPDGEAFVRDGRLIFGLEGAPADSEASGSAALPARIAALATADGSVAWTAAAPESGFLAAADEFVVVGRWPGLPDPEAEIPGMEAELTILRVRDGSPAGAGRLARATGMVWTAGAVLAAEEAEGRDAMHWAGWRLPGLEPLWTTGRLAFDGSWRIGGDLLFGDGLALRRIDLLTGRETGRTELGPLWAGGRFAIRSAAACLEALAPAGEALLLATLPECGPRRLVLLDGETLRPWRVWRGPDTVAIGGLAADGRTAVAVTLERVVAFALDDAGR